MDIQTRECLPGGTSHKEATCQLRRRKKLGFNPWDEKIPWKRVWQPTPAFLPENPVDGGAWQATVHGSQGCTRLKRLSTHRHSAPVINAAVTVFIVNIS